jgi:drug/metabolite transporter (DMT)-like permease
MIPIRKLVTTKESVLPIHLVFPLFSSVVFVLGMILAKQAIVRGASPWTGTFLGNLWLGLIWVGIAIYRGAVVPAEAWPDAAIIGLLFVCGQLFTYLAYQLGDVSVATPVLGVKVLMVALLTSILAHETVPSVIWISGALACVGIVLIQWTGRSVGTEDKPTRTGLTILMALCAAFSLSLFDVCLQKWAKGTWDSFAFLPVMFGTAAVLSLGFLPKVDSLSRLRDIKATKWLLGGTLLMATQAMSMCYCLAHFGDAPRINIVYALRGLWGVLLAWLLAKVLRTNEASIDRRVMLRRLAGAVLLTGAVLLAVTA